MFIFACLSLLSPLYFIGSTKKIASHVKHGPIDSLLGVLNLPSSVIKGFTNNSNTDCPWYTEYRKTNYVTFVSSFFDGGKSQNELTSAKVSICILVIVAGNRRLKFTWFMDNWWPNWFKWRNWPKWPNWPKWTSPSELSDPNDPTGPNDLTDSKDPNISNNPNNPKMNQCLHFIAFYYQSIHYLSNYLAVTLSFDWPMSRKFR